MKLIEKIDNYINEKKLPEDGEVGILINPSKNDGDDGKYTVVLRPDKKGGARTKKSIEISKHKTLDDAEKAKDKFIKTGNYVGSK